MENQNISSDKGAGSPPAKPVHKEFLTMKLLSVEISDLMELICDDSKNEALDQEFLSKAISYVEEGKNYLKKADFARAQKCSEKAFKKMEELYLLRKDDNPDYQVLLAPFYYFLGHVTATYLEEATDVLGNLVPLPEVSDSEDEEEKEEPAEQEAQEAGQETGVEEEKEEIDPKIEEEKIDTEIKKKEDKEEDESITIYNLVLEHLSLALQIMTDFILSDKALTAAKDVRTRVLKYLLIDATVRRAEIEMFKEQFGESISDYISVIELCMRHKEGNEKTLASSYFSIGLCNNMLKRSMEAKEFFEKASLIYRELLIKKYNELGRVVDESATYESLIEPTAYDNEEVDELKANYRDMVQQAQDATLCEQETQQLEQLKKEDEAKDEVDPNFGKPQVNKEQFLDVTFNLKIGAKRTAEEAFGKEALKSPESHEKRLRKEKASQDD